MQARSGDFLVALRVTSCGDTRRPDALPPWRRTSWIRYVRSMNRWNGRLGHDLREDCIDADCGRGWHSSGASVARLNANEPHLTVAYNTADENLHNYVLAGATFDAVHESGNLTRRVALWTAWSVG